MAILDLFRALATYRDYELPEDYGMYASFYTLAPGFAFISEYS